MIGIVRQGDADPLIRIAQNPTLGVVPTATIICPRPYDWRLCAAFLILRSSWGHLPRLHLQLVAAPHLKATGDQCGRRRAESVS